MNAHTICGVLSAGSMRFYIENQPTIQSYLSQFINTKKSLGDLPSANELIAWAALLETLPIREGKATYGYAKPYLMQTLFFPARAQQLQALLIFTLQQIQNQVVLYDVADVHLEDLDHHIGHNGNHRSLTYRWVKDECLYSSYALANQLIRLMQQNPKSWQASRVYLITAYPETEEFLTPARTVKFSPVNGQETAYWKYHTAVLVLLEQEHHFVPVVLDPLLHGTTPLTLDKWQDNFAVHTRFTVQPFRRYQEIENALK